MKREKKFICLIMFVFILNLLSLDGLCANKVAANTNGKSDNYVVAKNNSGVSNWWKYWCQGASKYSQMRKSGCRMTAYSKVIMDMGIELDPDSFNPDKFYEWCRTNGYISGGSKSKGVAEVGGKGALEHMSTGACTVSYAAAKGKTIYGKKWKIEPSTSEKQDELLSQMMNLLKNGCYLVIGNGAHYTYVDRDESLARGSIYIDDSFAGSSFNRATFSILKGCDKSHQPLNSMQSLLAYSYRPILDEWLNDSGESVENDEYVQWDLHQGNESLAKITCWKDGNYFISIAKEGCKPAYSEQEKLNKGDVYNICGKDIFWDFDKNLKEEGPLFIDSGTYILTVYENQEMIKHIAKVHYTRPALEVKPEKLEWKMRYRDFAINGKKYSYGVQLKVGEKIDNSIEGYKSYCEINGHKESKGYFANTLYSLSMDYYQLKEGDQLYEYIYPLSRDITKYANPRQAYKTPLLIGGSTKNITLDIGQYVTISNNEYWVYSDSVMRFEGTKSKANKISIPSNVNALGRKYKVVQISKGALKNKRKIKKLVIGKNVEKIEGDVFTGCKNLTSITIKTTKLNTVDKSAFKGIKRLKIKVPKKCMKKYMKLFKNKGCKNVVVVC